MGLVKFLRKLKRREKEVRILVLGLDNAGKTTIMERFTGGNIDEIQPTVGFQIKTLNLMGMCVNIWDVGGQKNIRSFWKNYFESTDGIVWVVDSSDVFRMHECRAALESLLVDEKLMGAPLLVFANKQDTPGCKTPGEIELLLGIPELTRSGTRQCVVMSSSLTDGVSVGVGFEWMLTRIGARSVVR